MGTGGKATSSMARYFLLKKLLFHIKIISLCREETCVGGGKMVKWIS
jgi:hypothetical protein